MSTSRVDELISYFKSHNKIREQQSHSAKVHSVGWSCDGKLLASGSFDKCVCIFSLGPDRLKQETTFRGHGGSVDQLCWHATYPELLSTASGDKTVRIWDTRTQKCTANISTRGENINISWSPDGNTIAVGNKEDLVTFIDARVMKIRAEEQFNFEVNEISWNKDSDTFYLTNGQGCVHILSYPNLELLHVIKAHPGTCICIEFDPTGRYFATGSADALVSLWDADELCCLRTFSRLEWPVRTISFSYDGQLLAAASEDLVIDIGEVETGEKIADIPVEAATFTVAWHPKQYLLAYACDDKDTYDRKRDAGSLKKQSFEVKESFNHVPSIREVDEEETDEEHACDEQAKSCKGTKQTADLTKDTSDVDSIYSNDSFCSDESCDESEEVKATSRTFNESSSSSPQVTERKRNEESGDAKNEQEGHESTKAISEITNSARCQSSMSEDNTIETKQIRRRRNMSFTDEEMRKIDWENQILLRKIMAQQKPKEKILRENASLPRISSSAINRKKLQKKIENENMFLLQRIQQTKSRVMNNMTKPGCRQTIL